ncbi:unnamed protein product [Pleuronectes platessa]|uniref:Uncharacterized protein n=1 Tax=Pleuronectes platessa TaxID=8262 RepID=A0A9N7Z6F7_PLEPL|nr:unnamed protein product [Pleuronectes platessa]
MCKHIGGRRGCGVEYIDRHGRFSLRKAEHSTETDQVLNVTLQMHCGYEKRMPLWGLSVKEVISEGLDRRENKLRPSVLITSKEPERDRISTTDRDNETL